MEMKFKLRLPKPTTSFVVEGTYTPAGITVGDAPCINSHSLSYEQVVEIAEEIKQSVIEASGVQKPVADPIPVPRPKIEDDKPMPEPVTTGYEGIMEGVRRNNERTCNVKPHRDESDPYDA